MFSELAEAVDTTQTKENKNSKKTKYLCKCIRSTIIYCQIKIQ